MRRLHVELLFAIDPARVGLAGDVLVRGPADEADMEVTLFSYEGAVLVTVGGVFNSPLAALSRARQTVLEVLGDLGADEAAAGLLEPIRTSVFDVCGYSKHLQGQPALDPDNGRR